MDRAHEIIREIKEKRSAGECFVVVKSLSPDAIEVVHSLDAMARFLDFYQTPATRMPEQDRPVSLTIEEATAISILILSKDMAYGTSIMTEDDARDLVDRFFQLFVGTKKFFSNMKVPEDFINFHGAHKTKTSLSYVSVPVTGHTFEAGVFVVCDELIGAIWVGDED